MTLFLVPVIVSLVSILPHFLNPDLKLSNEVFTHSAHCPVNGSIENDKEAPQKLVSKKSDYLNRIVFHFPTGNVTSDMEYLFVVNFHWPQYESKVHLLEYFELFHQHFNYSFDVIMLGPIESNGVLSNGLPPRGVFSYHTLAYIFHNTSISQTYLPKLHSYSGFVFMNDDSYIHPQFFMSYLEKSPNTSFCEPYSANGMNTMPYWNYKSNSRNVTYYMAQTHALNIIQSNETLRSQCVLNGGPSRWKGFADFFYVSKSSIPLFLELEQIMYSNEVFLEHAVPSIFSCLHHMPVDSCNHRKQMGNITSCVHVHPMKYSFVQNVKAMKARISEEDMQTTPFALKKQV